MAKWLKLKFKTFWGLIPTFLEVTGEKVVGVGGGGGGGGVKVTFLRCDYNKSFSK